MSKAAKLALTFFLLPVSTVFVGMLVFRPDRLGMALAFITSVMAIPAGIVYMALSTEEGSDAH